MDFLEAVNLGMEKAPYQTFGFFVDTSTKSACVLGTAYLGLYDRNIEYDRFGLHVSSLLHAFPILSTTTCSCPGCGSCVETSVFRMCTHLNDFHQWGRLRIAEWVMSL